MLSRQDLRKIAKARLKDAEVLFTDGRYDGAVYLCGYAVEIAIKARICKHLRWAGFPESNKEFSKLQSLKTHDLEVLLSLSGIEAKVRTHHITDWSIVITWNAEDRYKPIGSATRHHASNLIESAKRLMGVIQ